MLRFFRMIIAYFLYRLGFVPNVTDVNDESDLENFKLGYGHQLNRGEFFFNLPRTWLRNPEIIREDGSSY